MNKVSLQVNLQKTIQEEIALKTSKYESARSTVDPTITGIMLPLQEFHVFCEQQTPFRFFRDIQKFIGQIPNSKQYMNITHLSFDSRIRNKKQAYWLFVSNHLLKMIHEFMCSGEKSEVDTLKNTLPKVVATIIRKNDIQKESENIDNQYIDITSLEEKYTLPKRKIQESLEYYIRIFHFPSIKTIPINQETHLHTWFNEKRYHVYSLRSFLCAKFPQYQKKSEAWLNTRVHYLTQHKLPDESLMLKISTERVFNNLRKKYGVVGCSEKELFDHIQLYLLKYEKTYQREKPLDQI